MSKIEISEDIIKPSETLRLTAIIDGQLFQHHYTGYTSREARRKFRYRIKKYLSKTKAYK